MGSAWSQQLTEQDLVLQLMDAGAGSTGPGSVRMAVKQDQDVVQRLQSRWACTLLRRRARCMENCQVGPLSVSSAIRETLMLSHGLPASSLLPALPNDQLKKPTLPCASADSGMPRVGNYSLCAAAGPFSPTVKGT